MRNIASPPNYGTGQPPQGSPPMPPPQGQQGPVNWTGANRAQWGQAQGSQPMQGQAQPAMPVRPQQSPPGMRGFGQQPAGMRGIGQLMRGAVDKLAQARALRRGGTPPPSNGGAPAASVAPPQEY